MKSVITKAIAVASVIPSLCLLVGDAEAIPAFARKYATSCSTCHVAYPKLNAFGTAFRMNGYRMPSGDEELAKQKDVPLGSEGWKRVWPKGIWPGAIPGGFPFAVVIPSQVNVAEGQEVTTDFALPSEVALIGGGTLGESFGFYAGVTLLEGNEFGGLHRLFGQFDSLADTNMLNVRFGFMEPRAVPFSGHRKLTLSNYLMNAVGFDLNTMSGLGHEQGADEHGHGEAQTAHGEDIHAEAPRVLEIGSGHHGGGGGALALGGSQRGIELWGAHGGAGGGGLEYGFGIVNGNGAGNEGVFDDNSFKDVYWRAAYKFGGMGLTGRTGAGVAEPTQTENWVDNSLRIGTFGYYGRSPFRLSRAAQPHDEHGEAGPELIEGDESFTRIGADFSLWAGDLNLFGAFMYGKNDRQGFEGNEGVDFNTWFIQGDYVVLPWIVTALRYEKVDLPEEFLDIERAVPHVTLLLRANIKLVTEGQLYRNDSGRNRGLFNLTFAF